LAVAVAEPLEGEEPREVGDETSDNCRTFLF